METKERGKSNLQRRKGRSKSEKGVKKRGKRKRLREMEQEYKEGKE